MISSFKNQGTENIFDGKNTNVARKICPQKLWKIAARKLGGCPRIVMTECAVAFPSYDAESNQ